MANKGPNVLFYMPERTRSVLLADCEPAAAAAGPPERQLGTKCPILPFLLGGVRHQGPPSSVRDSGAIAVYPWTCAGGHQALHKGAGRLQLVGRGQGVLWHARRSREDRWACVHPSACCPDDSAVPLAMVPPPPGGGGSSLIHLVLFGSQNRTFGPYLAAIHRTLIPKLCAVHVLLPSLGLYVRLCLLCPGREVSRCMPPAAVPLSVRLSVCLPACL
jgi:hypothetical protein